MANAKLTYDQMEFVYHSAIEAAVKTLFDDHFKDHGWTEKEFVETLVATQQAIAEGKIQRWMN